MPVTVPQPLLTRPDAWVGMPWIPLALHELGVHEVPGAGDNPRVLEYLATCTANTALLHDETPWCSAFVNWCMLHAGQARTHSLAARSWENYGSLCTIQNGCILVFRRRTPADPQGLHHGHVGFKVGETQYSYLVLGGNENNQVSIKPYAKTDLICGRLP